MNTENLNMTPEEQEQYNQFLEQFMKSIDPTDYMPPSVREIARMDMDTLKTEYEMVQARTSLRSSTQRRMIVERYEFEIKNQDAEQQ
jgi:hypothetical protein